MSLQAKVAGGVILTGVMGLLSLGIIGILVTLVINLGRLLSVSTSLPPEYADTLKFLKIINGALLVIPIAIFIMCAYDIGKLVANPLKGAAEKVMSEVSGKQGPVKKRPILFGSLFFIFSGVIIGALVYTGVVFGGIAEYYTTTQLAEDFPLTVDKLNTLKNVALYTTIIPGFIILFSIILIFKAIKEKKKNKSSL
jgi:hypothetical protein